MNDLAPPLRSLTHVTDWVFDLDNTLYPRTCNLFAQIDLRITNYVMDLTKLDFEAARDLQKGYYRDFGTTLNGLMQQHKVDAEHYLDDVHAIDYSPVEPHPELVNAISLLPGRKFVLTNGDTKHARSVLDKLGGPHLFEHVHDIRAMTYVPKPHRTAYEGFFALHGIDPTRAVMFDDLEKNLVVPHEMGMVTVHVVAPSGFAHDQVEAWELGRSSAPHVHHVTDNLSQFLLNRP